MTRDSIAFVGLGANLGDAAANVARAVHSLDSIPGTRVLRASRRYRTPAWGLEQQPDFVNAVAMLETQLDARALLDALLDIEKRHGRERDHAQRWGPRVLDLDLLLHGDQQLDQPGLTLPHPHLHERAFVLVPLVEIAPHLDIPGRGPARAALMRLQASDIVALES